MHYFLKVFKKPKYYYVQTKKKTEHKRNVFCLGMAVLAMERVQATYVCMRNCSRMQVLVFFLGMDTFVTAGMGTVCTVGMNVGIRLMFLLDMDGMDTVEDAGVGNCNGSGKFDAVELPVDVCVGNCTGKSVALDKGFDTAVSDPEDM